MFCYVSVLLCLFFAMFMFAILMFVMLMFCYVSCRYVYVSLCFGDSVLVVGKGIVNRPKGQHSRKEFQEKVLIAIS